MLRDKGWGRNRSVCYFGIFRRLDPGTITELTAEFLVVTNGDVLGLD